MRMLLVVAGSPDIWKKQATDTSARGAGINILLLSAVIVSVFAFIYRK